MEKHADALYEAFKSKDNRFDGRFFVGVTSTGVYCRPVCGARLAKKENCLFFRTAAEAEKAGFRPCLICRPELAPGLSVADAKSVLAKRAARYIEENCAEGASLQELAAKLGYTGRHLRRAFKEEFHVSPIEYTNTCRLLLSKGLLTDTRLSVIDVAMAAGFGSLRRFNALFRERYRLSPTGFRKRVKSGESKVNSVTVALGYKPPYAWDRMLAFLAMRAIPGVERVSDGTYSRTVRVRDKDRREIFGWLTVSNRPEKNLLEATVSDGLLPALAQVLGRVRNLFDLYCDPYAVNERLAGDAAPGAYVFGLRVPGCFDPFELCVRAILGQQITVKAAGTLAGKLAKTLGRPLETGMEGLAYAFPSAGDIASAGKAVEKTLGELGVISARAGAIYSLARAIENGELDFGSASDAEAEKAKLTRIAGIGPWTATYIAMRALGDPDAFAQTDLGIRKALGGKKPPELLDMARKWKPWRSYATMALWDSLGGEEKK